MTAGSLVQALTVGGTLGSVEVTLSGIGGNSFLYNYGSDDPKDEANPGVVPPPMAYNSRDRPAGSNPPHPPPAPARSLGRCPQYFP